MQSKREGEPGTPARNAGTIEGRRKSGSPERSRAGDVLWIGGFAALLAGAFLGARPAPAARDPKGSRGGASGERSTSSGRGRDADTPSEIPARGWSDILWRVYAEVSDDRLIAVAAGVTFYVLLAVFPAIAAFVSLYGLFADAATVSDHVALMSGVLPDGALQIINEQVTRITSQGEAALGFGFFLGLGISLWSANQGIKAMFDALNVVYDEPEKRSFVKLTALSLAFTLGAILFLLVAIGGVVVVPVVLNLIGLGSSLEWLLQLARWPLMLVGVALAIALMYRYGPSRRVAKWRWISWGSALAAFLWVVVSVAFSWYVASFGSYNETYGSLGAVVGFMTWIWLSVAVVLLGAELDAEMEHQTARDTTEGAPKPMGARGASMADTLGSAQR